MGLKGLKSPFHMQQYALPTCATKVESTDATSADQEHSHDHSNECAPQFGCDIQTVGPSSFVDQGNQPQQRHYSDTEPASRDDSSQQLPYEYSEYPATYPHSQPLPQVPSQPLVYVNSQPLPRFSLQSAYARHSQRHAQPPPSYLQPFNSEAQAPLGYAPSGQLPFGPPSLASSIDTTLQLTHSLQSMDIASSTVSSTCHYPLISGLGSTASSSMAGSTLRGQASMPGSGSARTHHCYLLKLAILHATVRTAQQCSTWL